jgi:hypothetical protein
MEYCMKLGASSFIVAVPHRISREEKAKIGMYNGRIIHTWVVPVLLVECKKETTEKLLHTCLYTGTRYEAHTLAGVLTRAYSKAYEEDKLIV